MNATQMANKAIEIATKHAGENDSAKLCLEDAKECARTDRLSAAKARALTSLRHSVGIFHEDYKTVSAL